MTYSAGVVSSVKFWNKTEKGKYYSLIRLRVRSILYRPLYIIYVLLFITFFCVVILIPRRSGFLISALFIRDNLKYIVSEVKQQNYKICLFLKFFIIYII